MAKIAQLGVTKRGIESGLRIVRILLLEFGEVFGRVFPFPFEHIETPQLEGGLRIGCSAVCVGINTQSVLQVVGTSGISFAQEHTFYVWLKRALRHLGRLLHQLVLGERKCRIALVEYLISKPA